MSRILDIIKERYSSRAAFDREHLIDKQDMLQILEAARWAPTAHNMQNFEIIVVDNVEQLRKLEKVRSKISEDFLRENYQQLSFTEEELLRKKVGLLGTMFPLEWRTVGDWKKVALESEPSPLQQIINGSPMLLIVIYDSRKRAPASEGDILGLISLGCVMENMWLTAQSLGIGFQILSIFGIDPVQEEVIKILEIPEFMNIAYAIRLGYPISDTEKIPRVRRDLIELAHHNRFGIKDFE